MAVLTVTQSGPQSDPDTFGGTPFSDGDTIVCGAFTLTLDVDESLVGNSPNDTTTEVIDLTSGSAVLVVAADTAVTVAGNIGGSNGSTFRMAAGSTLTFDASASGGTPTYKLINGGFWVYEFLGTSGSRCVVQAVTGRLASLSAPVSDYTATYTDFHRITAFVSGNDVFNLVNVSGCTFDGCGKLDVTSSAADARFVGNTWTNSTDASDSVRLSFSGAYTRRLFERNVLDKGLTYASTGFTFRHNYLPFAFSSATSYSFAEFRENWIGRATDAVIAGPVRRNYCYSDRVTGNPHWLDPVALGADTAVEQNVFESGEPDLVDVGDCLVVQGVATSGGAKIYGRNNLVLPNSSAGATVTSGCLLTCYNLDSAARTQFARNTVNVDLSAVAGRRGAFAVAEAGDGAADQVEELKSNLAWGSSASQGYLGERVAGTVLDIITASGADYNWRHNTSDGDNGRGYEDRDGSGDLWTGGDAAAAGVDDNQGSGDPQFVDEARDMVAWATARGYGSTAADAKAALQADPSRVADLIDYIFAGFKVQAVTMRNAAHDGGAVGAANWDDPARSLANVTAFEAYINANYGVSV